MTNERADRAFRKSVHTIDPASGVTRIETGLAKKANIADLVLASGSLARKQVKELLSPERLTSNDAAWRHAVRRVSGVTSEQ
jgi:hypothetical protein